MKNVIVALHMSKWKYQWKLFKYLYWMSIVYIEVMIWHGSLLTVLVTDVKLFDDKNELTRQNHCYSIKW